MSDFTSAYDAINLDSAKRVHYAHGLVLGVEEFVQAEHYLLSKERLHNRALHGYGTVCGLQVEPRLGTGGAPEVLVRAGIALDPRGREIRVLRDQCADLHDWLDANADTLAASPLPDPLPLYVVLCFRECTTDDVPVPGGPCRSLEDSRVPSRIADDFVLELRTEPPAQVEEDAVRAFGDLLRAIRISDAPGDFLTADQLEELVRGLGGGSPAGVAGIGSPPLYRLHPDTAADLLEDAFRVWVTEVRPFLLPEGRNCAGGPPLEGCVLLARLDLTLADAGGQLRLLDGDLANIDLDESARPYLLHTRLLQEWLLTRSDTVLGDAGGDLDGSYPDPVVVGLQGNPVAPPPSPLVAGQVLTWDGAAWQALDLPPAGVTDHGALGGLGDVDDHLGYLTLDGSRPMTGALRMGNNRIRGLVPGAASGQAVEFDQAIKDGDAVPAGDLTGTYPSPTIANLQGRTLNAVPGADGEVITWDQAASQWVARPVPAAGGGTEQETGLTRIHALSWFHGRGGNNLTYELDGNRVLGVVIQFGREAPGDVTVRVDSTSISAQNFQLFVRFPFAVGGQFIPRTYHWVGLEPRQIVAVEGQVGPNPGQTVVTATGGARGPAVAFDIDPRALVLLQFMLSQQQPLFLRVELQGDQALDEDGRAVDAELVRGQLPTGDRPAGGARGIQGGLFQSWLQFTGQIDPGGDNPAFGGNLFAPERRTGDAGATSDTRPDRDAPTDPTRGLLDNLSDLFRRDRG
jgi:hypothetical protein